MGRMRAGKRKQQLGLVGRSGRGDAKDADSRPIARITDGQMPSSEHKPAAERVHGVEAARRGNGETANAGSEIGN